LKKEQEAKEANKKHVKAIQKEAVKSLYDFLRTENTNNMLETRLSQAVIEAIHDGLVKHVTINY